MRIPEAVSLAAELGSHIGEEDSGK
jgi:hypothetical protein